MSQEKLWQSHKMAAVGRLSSDVAHEFNNLMQGVVASLELTRKLMSGGRASEAEHFIVKAVASAQNASLLNQRLARFSQFQPIAPQPLSINAVVADVEDLLRHTLPRAFNLEIESAADLGTVYCDAGQAEIAIVDMVLDARDSMPDGGAITIATRKEERPDNGSVSHASHVPGHWICIAVTGTVGPNPESSDRGFTPRSPADATKCFSPLRMVDHFARIYGGEIRLRRDAPHCAATELSLPRCRPPDEQALS